MPEIRLLPKEIAELIAAGEVVERPASVIKELVENSIDAGATRITVEINRGGVTYMRITDNGCGISAGDVPTAFLRHATSKIKNSSDLAAIGTLGFRGEALAAVSSVSKTEMFTKTADETFGVHYVIEGGVECENSEAGCPDGTTVVVRDLFYNTPARMKFLKKDVSEGNAVSAVVERAALSHPEIAFRLIRDGKQTLVTSGDGQLKSAVYSLLGREFADSLIPVSAVTGGVGVEGFTCKPVFCRATRAGQFMFLNGRLIRSSTVMAAAEQAYKNSAMVGKFPAFVLCITVPPETVDVNVHPAKTEVRFSDEKRIFDAVYTAVRAAINSGDTRPTINFAKKSASPFFGRMSASDYRQQGISMPAAAEKPDSRRENTAVQTQNPQTTPQRLRMRQDDLPYFMREDVKRVVENNTARATVHKAPEMRADSVPSAERIGENSPQPQEPVFENATVKPQSGEEYSPETEVRFIGEAFSVYIIVERGDSIFLIDKHAAHERINFNALKTADSIQMQSLLVPVTVRLGAEEYSAVLKNTKLLQKAGFETEDFGNGTVVVRTVPTLLIGADTESAVTEAAASLAEKGLVEIEALDRIYHTVACKAAIKAGSKTTPAELLLLAKRALESDDVRYCPHGRPVAFEITRHELEKQFGRIQ